MDSATSKNVAEEQRQADLRRQIALLQAQLNDGATSDPVLDLPPSPGRKRPSTSILVPDTPSKKKKAAEPQKKHAYVAPSSTHTRVSGLSAPLPKAGPSFPLQRSNASATPPPPSTVLQKLAKAHNKKTGSSEREAAITRSTAFSSRPPAPSHDPSDEFGTKRDDDMTLIEDLTLGPADHKPPFDDPHFEKLEPNSGIRLASRVLLHDDIQDHLRGRYYLSPSKLYSVVRLLPNKQGYDVPVAGDWLTIAVVAERGKMKYTQAPVGVTRDDKINQEGDQDRMDALPAGLDNPSSAQSGPSRPPPFQKRKKPEDDGFKPGGKKYVNMKLIDFGCRTRGASADGGKAKIRGDAFLSLLLFESDTCDILTKEDGTKQKVYRGGSKGAFERMSKLREGAVVALLNPKILKPFQRSADKPHPTENILALTPESDESIAIIGYAQDLGMCVATKRDGSRCNSWCDKRVSDVCDYHIQHAIERRRAARPEFAVGTSGMSSSAAKAKKKDYDPARQWGLKPEGQASGSTYIVSGHIVSGSDSKSMFIGENYGREAQAKAARKVAAADADKNLKRLLSKNKKEMKSLPSTAESSKRRAEEVKLEAKEKKAKAKAQPDAPETSEDKQPHRKSYSAQMIKQLGFDPGAKDGKTVKDAEVQSRLNALAALSAARKIDLGPRPGRTHSCVRKPNGPPKAADLPTPSRPPATDDDLEYAEEPGSPLAFPDSDDDELEREERKVFGKPIGLTEDSLIDLDDSDDE
ncbi:hypothetical protein GSI_10436 [Ganoderma sinense ZZ0214-1]|uniref:Zinc finger Mcm10/DnaG-type domain-containing protein n=1 Tax=Ganoderma sinense ZZ0214-1 TaxID=1077348 RepID=A0A2G8S0J3_9APHY|nr:hypothetical protein GSI_10436 [Ganoderma sinense ZZ0214-1]